MAIGRGVGRLLVVLVVVAELFLGVGVWAAYTDWKDAEIEFEARRDLERATKGYKTAEPEWWEELEYDPETTIAQSHNDQVRRRFWMYVGTAIALPFLAAGAFFAVLWIWAGFRKDPADLESS